MYELYINGHYIKTYIHLTNLFKHNLRKYKKEPEYLSKGDIYSIDTIKEYFKKNDCYIDYSSYGRRFMIAKRERKNV